MVGMAVKTVVEAAAGTDEVCTGAVASTGEAAVSVAAVASVFITIGLGAAAMGGRDAAAGARTKPS